MLSCGLGCLDSGLTLMAVEEVPQRFRSGFDADNQVYVDLLMGDLNSEPLALLQAYNRWVALLLKEGKTSAAQFLEDHNLRPQALEEMTYHKRQAWQILNHLGLIPSKTPPRVDQPPVFIDTGEASRFAQEPALLRAILCAMYGPQIALQLESEKSSPLYRTRDAPVARVNTTFTTSNLAPTYLVYAAETHSGASQVGQTSHPVLTGTTVVSLWPLLLFALAPKEFLLPQ